jgi:hypothetical protein
MGVDARTLEDQAGERDPVKEVNLIVSFSLSVRVNDNYFLKIKYTARIRNTNPIR